MRPTLKVCLNYAVQRARKLFNEPTYTNPTLSASIENFDRILAAFWHYAKKIQPKKHQVKLSHRFLTKFWQHFDSMPTRKNQKTKWKTCNLSLKVVIESSVSRTQRTQCLNGSEQEIHKCVTYSQLCIHPLVDEERDCQRNFHLKSLGGPQYVP